MPARLGGGRNGLPSRCASWRRTALGGLAVLLLTAAPAPAVLLEPGATVRAGAPGALPVGTVLASRTSPFILDTGEIQTMVIRNNDTGFLTFTYRFRLFDLPNLTPVNRLETVDFSDLRTDIRYAFLAPGDVAPTVFWRSPGEGMGLALSFLQHGSIVPMGVGRGQTSALLIVDTDATDFIDDGLTFTFDGVADCAFTFSGIRAVPEPGTLAIALLAGLPLLGVVRRYRQRP